MKKQTKSNLTKKILTLVLLTVVQVNAVAEDSMLDENLVFDERMFRGSNISQSVLEQLTTESSPLPGNYSNTPIIMNKLLVGEDNVTLIQRNKKTVTCLSKTILEKAGFEELYIRKLDSLHEKTSCVELSELTSEATVKLNSDLALEFIAAQAVLKNKNGEISESALNRGESVFFSNYVANYFHNKQSGIYSGESDYSYLSLNSGLNIGLWQFRQLSSYNYNTSNYKNGKSNSATWNNISSYFQRPIYEIKSNVVVGKINTSGQFFGGLGYNGIELSSDERMYPVAEQGYAPTISGIAKTNALIEVRQNNALIYQTTVSAGRFVIRNINPTSYNGDLNVTVIESDGSRTSFLVPFSAVPDSIRPGKIKYSASAGKTRNLIIDEDFIDSSIQYGLNNFITIGSGARLANDYKAGVLSSVFSTRFGAFGINGTFSSANLGGEYGVREGGMANFTYSKTFQPTSTNVSLAGYRYSTAGYREFSDFIYEKHYVSNGTINRWNSNTYLQKYRLTASVYQPLDQFGNLSFSISTQEYNSGRARDLYYQLNYNKTLLNRVNASLSLSRQKNGIYYPDRSMSSNYDTVTMLTFNIPLGDMTKSVSSSAYFDKRNGNQYQTSLSGSAGDRHSPYSYNLNVNHSEGGHQTAYSANLNKQYSQASVSVNSAKGDNYTQLGMGVTGAVVAHSGGILFGPYLGNTFGIVEAKNASGAKIYNGQGATINSSGYALVPSLMPYRYNSIGLTSDGLLNNNVDIESSEQRVAPYAGSAVMLKFKTNQGYPLLVTLMTKNKISIPIGAVIIDDTGKEIGIVGQNNKAYFRTSLPQAEVKAVWGDNVDESCLANYSISPELINQDLIKISVPCL
ncbi:fimbria/pilus outer membrane usher protein [Pectobacterium colocasium]|uniref:fimbria/pilus outer membrane usher protein n=1 Tax=Pectobacterium colocasium TaxID=2878098 RepID=UPI001CD2A5DC|nr:fimbria/pilus outer membrane usher protein [Pectobacterium colocasium]